MSSVVLREHLLLVKCNSNERAPYFFSKISTYIYESYRKTLISLKLSCTSSFIPCPTRCFRHSTTTKNELKTKKRVPLRRAGKKNMLAASYFIPHCCLYFIFLFFQIIQTEFEIREFQTRQRARRKSAIVGMCGVRTN